MPDKPVIKKKLAKTIKDIRFKIGMTQRKLASLTGLNERYVSEIETGAHNLTIDTLESIASGLSTTVSALVAGDGAENAVVVAKDEEVVGLENATILIDAFLGHKKTRGRKTAVKPETDKD